MLAPRHLALVAELVYVMFIFFSKNVVFLILRLKNYFHIKMVMSLVKYGRLSNKLWLSKATLDLSAQI